MKKIIIFVITLLSVIVPFKVNALNLADYNTTDLKAALESEDIEPKFDKLKENDEQVTIYLFRGQGCPHCTDFLNYLNDIYEEEGDKFKVVSFESWYDTDNADLLVDVATFLDFDNPEKTGVPLIIIGEEHFSGFAEDTYGDAVLSAINDEYAKDPSDRYDLLEAIAEEEPEEKETIGLSVGGAVIIALAAVAIVIVYDTIRFNKLQDEVRQLAYKKNK